MRPVAQVLLILICIFPIAQLYGQSDPVFVLNTPGHSSSIIKVFGDEKDQRLVTVSVDKSIAVWNTANWTLVKRFWLDIGVGDKGKIIDADYNSRKNLLAVARLNSLNEPVVTLIDVESYEIRGNYRGFSKDLGFVSLAPDATFIITGPWQISTGLEQPKIWKVPEKTGNTPFNILKPVNAYSEPRDIIHDFAVSQDKLIITDFNETIVVSIIHDQSSIPEYKFKKIKKLPGEHAVWAQEGNSFLTGSHSGWLRFMSSDLSEQTVRKSDDNNVINIFRGERYAGAWVQNKGLHLYEMTTHKAYPPKKFSFETMTVLNDSLVVYTVDSKIRLYNFEKDKFSDPFGVDPIMKSIGVATNEKIVFDNYSKMVDLQTLELETGSYDSSRLSLNKHKYYDFKLEKANVSIRIDKEGKRFSDIWNPAISPISYGFTNQGNVIYSSIQYHGTHQRMRLFNQKATQTHELFFPADGVVNFAPANDINRNEIAGLSNDGTIHLWNPDDPDYTWNLEHDPIQLLDNAILRKVPAGLEVASQDTHMRKIEQGDIITGLDSLNDLTETKIREYVLKKSPFVPMKLTINRKGKSMVIEMQINKHKEIHPVVSFHTRDNEWLAWNHSGYYASSAGGEKLGGWVVNRGESEIADFHPMSDFKKEFYKPELIKEIVKQGSVSQGIEVFNKNSDVRIDREKSFSKKLPPGIEWLYPKNDSSVSRAQTKVSVVVNSASPIQSAKVLLNGRTVLKREQLDIRAVDGDRHIITTTVDLPGKENIINLYIENENGSSISEGRTISVAQTAVGLDKYKPNLYMVCVGVSKYNTPSFNLTYANADAQSVAKMYQSQKGKLYNEVFIKTLVDEQATRGNILDAFYWLEQNSTQKDVSIIFIASHGLNEKDKFYILPHDGDPERIRITGVDWMDFADVLGNLPSKVMVFIDACHSGKLGSNLSAKRGNADITDAIRALATEENGVVIMSASTGKESSLESSDWSHGAFTLALLDGLEKGAADINHDGVVNVRELDYYVAERVKQLTSGMQHPTTQKPSVVGEFPLIQTSN